MIQPYSQSSAHGGTIIASPKFGRRARLWGWSCRVGVSFFIPEAMGRLLSLLSSNGGGLHTIWTLEVLGKTKLWSSFPTRLVTRLYRLMMVTSERQVYRMLDAAVSVYLRDRNSPRPVNLRSIVRRTPDYSRLQTPVSSNRGCLPVSMNLCYRRRILIR